MIRRIIWGRGCLANGLHKPFTTLCSSYTMRMLDSARQSLMYSLYHIAHGSPVSLLTDVGRRGHPPGLRGATAQRQQRHYGAKLYKGFQNSLLKKCGFLVYKTQFYLYVTLIEAWPSKSFVAAAQTSPEICLLISADAQTPPNTFGVCPKCPSARATGPAPM